MSLKELEAEALKLPEADRVLLAKRLLASASTTVVPIEEDPILHLGSTPVLVDALDGSTEHDKYLYDHAQR